MKVLAFVLLVVLCWAPSGCGGGGNGSTGSPGVNNTASLSGNWQLTSNSTVALGATGNISASLATSGTTVTGIAHISSPCYAYITDVPLSGQIKGDGTFTVSSGSVNSQILTITGTSLGSSISNGAYSIVGGCGAGDKGTVSGYTLAALTGTYSGTISTGSGSSVSVVAHLTQSTTANSSSGFYTATGSATFIGSYCSTEGTVASSSLVLGNEFLIDVTTPGPSPSTVTMAGIFDAAAKAMTVQVYYGGVCGGSGTGTLTAQTVSSTSSLAFNGSANLVGNVISLTQDNMFNQDAAVWYNNTVDVSDGFHTTFQFQIHSPRFGSLASNGLAFVVQNTGTHAIGDAAYGGVEVGLHNLGPGIAVVFSTYNINSVEIASCGPTKSVDIGCPVAQTPSGSVVVNDGAIHSATIDYALGQLQVTLDGVLVLSTPIDIASQLTLTNGKAFVGFTAATGGGTEETDLMLWSYSSSGSAILFPQ